VAVDVIGVFKTPTRTWRYEYDTTGMRTAKQLDNTTGTGAEWRKEFSWMMVGGRPLLLAEHQGSQTALVIHGPSGVPIYQINTTGEVQYLHQDHQGSIRLTTNPNGTTRNVITYETTGQISGNTNWWIEQPLIGFASLQHDTETGYIHTGTRFYDPQSGQYTTSHPLSSIGINPYSFEGGNPSVAGERVGPTVGWINATGFPFPEFRLDESTLRNPFVQAAVVAIACTASAGWCFAANVAVVALNAYDRYSMHGLSWAFVGGTFFDIFLALIPLKATRTLREVEHAMVNRYGVPLLYYWAPPRGATLGLLARNGAFATGASLTSYGVGRLILDGPVESAPGCES